MAAAFRSWDGSSKNRDWLTVEDRD